MVFFFLKCENSRERYTRLILLFVRSHEISFLVGHSLVEVISIQDLH